MNQIVLPWPDKALNPNARVHFRAKAAIAKVQREASYWLAHNAQIKVADDDSAILLRIDFYPPDRRRRDLDNMLASSKSALDGIADGLCVNDQRFALWLSREAPVKGGKIVVVVTPKACVADAANPDEQTVR